MAKKIAARQMQYPLVAEFTFAFDDEMVDVNGVTKDFGTVGSAVFDIINMPNNAIVVGGSVTTETAVGGSTAYNVSVGDVNDPDRYLTATDRVSAGLTAIVPTGYVGNGESIRLTVAPTASAATAGKVSVRVHYVVRDRANEVQTH